MVLTAYFGPWSARRCGRDPVYILALGGVTEQASKHTKRQLRARDDNRMYKYHYV